MLPERLKIKGKRIFDVGFRVAFKTLTPITALLRGTE